MEWTLVSVTNNERILRSCLLRSPDIRCAAEVILQRGFKGAAEAYNNAIDRAKTDIIVFAHQDIYLAPGWLASLAAALKRLEVLDPNWGVLGVWGTPSHDGPPGHVWWTGLSEAGGAHFEGVREIRTLDEVVLIIRKSSKLRFDPHVGGFHLYGTDICLEAQKQGRRTYVFAGFCMHNTNEYGFLPREFWRNYFFLRKKWRAVLPVETPCADLTFLAWPFVVSTLAKARAIYLQGFKPAPRVDDPVALYEKMLACGAIKQSRLLG